MYGSRLSVLQKCMVACTYGTSESVLSEMAAEPIIFNGEDLRAKKQKEKIERLKKSLNDKAAGKPDTAPIT